MAEGDARRSPGAGRSRSLNYLLSSHVWRQDHNGFSHQDPGFIDHVVNKKAEIIRVYLPPDANTLLSVADHCLRSRDYVNVIVAGKQPALKYLSMEDAILHCTRGIGIWEWASNDEDGEPDVVLGCCGDVPTLEALAATAILRERLPGLRVRVVNVVDLMRLQPETEHPHGLSDQEFDSLFTTSRPVVFAYHGYPWLIHRLTYRRTNHPNLHVRGYKEEGTTTTPFDMVMLNDLDRFHLVMDVIDRRPTARRGAPITCGRTWSTAGSARARTDARARRGPARDPRLDLAGLSGGVAAILVVNAGSTSLKLSVVGAGDEDDGAPVDRGRSGGATPSAHRIVHGGRASATRSWSTTPSSEELAGLVELAPLHNGAGAVQALGGRARRTARTSRTSPSSTRLSTRRSRPRRRPTRCRGGWREDWGIRRYGFHGLSVQWASEQVPVERLVVCHLGGGCSVTAVRGGRSVDTTMGFTPLEGVPMATRPGSVDPGALLYLLRAAPDVEELDRELEHESGLRGLSGLSGDVRELERSDDPAARSRWRSSRTGSRRRSRRWLCRSAGSTRWCSRPGSASTPRA